MSTPMETPEPLSRAGLRLVTAGDAELLSQQVANDAAGIRAREWEYIEASRDISADLSACAKALKSSERNEAFFVRARGRINAADRAHRAVVSYWERRCTMLATQVKDLLACREIPPEQRAVALDTILGPGGRGRDAAILCLAEVTLVRCIRPMAGPDRQAIYKLAERFAAAVSTRSETGPDEPVRPES